MEIKLYKSPWRALKIALLCSVFVVPCIYFLTVPSFADKWVCYLGIGFFGLGYPVALFHFFDRRPQIIINETGIFDRTAFKEFINWEVIFDAYLLDVYRQKFVCIIIKSGVDLSDKLNSRTVKFNKALGFQEFNINLGQITIDEHRFAEFVVQMARAEKSQRGQLLKQLNT